MYAQTYTHVAVSYSVGPIELMAAVNAGINV
jgi:hypothetical protein